MSTNNWRQTGGNGYSPSNGGATPLDVVNSPVFGPAVLRAVQDPGLRSYITGHSVPWTGVDLPMVDDFPQAPQDRMEVNLLAGGGVDRYVYRQGTNKWYRIGGSAVLDAFPSDANEGDTATVVLNAGIWSFVYYPTGDATYPWHFTGGPFLHVDDNDAGTTGSATYTDLTSAVAGPEITITYAGVYDVTIEATMFQTTGGVGSVSYQIGGTTASDDEAIQESSTASGIAGVRSRRKTFATANTTLTMKYKTTSNTLNVLTRGIRALPVKVAA